ncbi:sodium/hydrogen exchanger 9B2-like [Trichogramma pretiosum]|uniref:sodium/hydrogen exchanger 9B2-like n=1 Tax=Trichogramma pretiosum TaxID=7493 RepID=UPI0006C97E8F|nr:sodium/hydrogen exchanger 9B2-like [Trichogramma pretiosum]
MGWSFSRVSPASNNANNDNNNSNNLPHYSGDELADPESTCCHRATWCVPGWRKLNVDESVAGCGCCDLTYATGFWLVTVLAILGLLYALLYLYVGEAMLPGGPYFGLYLVVCSSYFAGWALAYVPRVQLPPVFGMILAGILVRNLHWYNIEEALSMATTAKIRMFTATFVMLRAGLQLNTTTLRDHPRFIVLLALVPCTMEMCAVAVCARSLLDLPWGWAFLLGSITACLSPVIPINTMLALAEEGYGEDKHMASLLLTAASIDDVHIVSVYAICFSFVFNHDQGGSYWWSIFPNEIKDLLLGITFGTALGIFFVFFPHRKHKYVAWYRICGLVLGSLVCVASTYKVTITGSGYLATIIMSLIATSGWRVLSRPFDLQPLRQAVHIMWHLMQPVLCGVMGAEVDLSGWSLGRLGLYVICLACGLAVRSAFVFLSTWRSPFNKKERAFIALVWLAKGATQAALAPMVLEEALSSGTAGGEQQRRMGYVLDVVRMAVVTVLLMSPIPAVAIMIAGPRLLHRLDEEERSKQRELSLIRLLSLQPVRKRRH